MIAFVLSGAGNRGPLEVGALRALIEAGIKPDFLVGTSAGSINSGYLAAWGATVETTHQMEKMWQGVDAGDIYPENIVQVVWRVRTNANSLYSSTGMRDVLRKALPPGVTTFGQLKVKLYTTATDLRSSRLYLFGDDPKAPLIDAILASASVPGIHPPVSYNGLQLVDGGVVANVATSVAMDRGANQIYVINAGYGGEEIKAAEGVMEVLLHTLNTMLAQSLLEDIDRAKQDTKIDMHHINVNGFSGISFRDFNKTKEMVALGYQRASAYLANPAPLDVAPADVAPTVEGVTEYVPPFMR
ncbi:MAG: patatin-like phospholipase family protein [Anaerolineales bacterium]|nr:patatin-like phospholipase family protein [Anaerolineales bacterium]